MELPETSFLLTAGGKSTLPEVARSPERREIVGRRRVDWGPRLEHLFERKSCAIKMVTYVAIGRTLAGGFERTITSARLR